MDAVAAGTISSESQVIVFGAGREVTFGRDPSSHLRIGHAPVYDDVVPKVAGKVFVHGERVVVANLHDVLALDIRVDGRALISLPPGDWHAPAERTFDVLITGTFQDRSGAGIGCQPRPGHGQVAWSPRVRLDTS